MFPAIFRPSPLLLGFSLAAHHKTPGGQYKVSYLLQSEKLKAFTFTFNFFNIYPSVLNLTSFLASPLLTLSHPFLMRCKPLCAGVLPSSGGYVIGVDMRVESGRESWAGWVRLEGEGRAGWLHHSRPHFPLHTGHMSGV